VHNDVSKFAAHGSFHRKDCNARGLHTMSTKPAEEDKGIKFCHMLLFIVIPIHVKIYIIDLCS
jgi:hypothetical protein